MRSWTVLSDAVEARIADAIVPAIMRANRTDELNDLLELLGMGDLVAQDGRRPRGKIIVLGASEVKERKLRSIAKAHGPKITNNSFAHALETLEAIS